MPRRKPLSMPDFSIPKLLPEWVEVGVCAVLEKCPPELTKWVKGNQSEKVRAAAYNANGEPQWLSLDLQAWEDQKVHFHVEIHRGDVRDVKSKELVVIDKDDFVKIVTGFFKEAGPGDHFGVVGCELSVPLSSLPQHGTIATLLGFERRACDASFALTSGTLQIEDSFFDELTFRYDQKKDLVCVSLKASSYFTLSGTYIEEYAGMMEVGVDCFVYEQISREPSHA